MLLAYGMDKFFMAEVVACGSKLAARWRSQVVFHPLLVTSLKTVWHSMHTHLVAFTLPVQVSHILLVTIPQVLLRHAHMSHLLFVHNSLMLQPLRSIPDRSKHLQSY